MFCACAPSSGTVGDDTAVWDRGRNTVRKANSVEPIADEIMEHFLSDATKRRKPGRWKQIRDTVAETTPAGMLGGSAAIMNYDFTTDVVVAFVTRATAQGGGLMNM